MLRGMNSQSFNAKRFVRKRCGETDQAMSGQEKEEEEEEEDILGRVRYNLVGEGFEGICADTGDKKTRQPPVSMPFRAATRSTIGGWE